MRVLPRGLIAGLTCAAAALAALTAPSARAATEPVVCDLVAAPGGSDASPGTAAEPFATVQRLADALGPGQTGCLRAGSYVGDVTVRHGGTPFAPETIRAYPGEQATVVGRLYLARGADYVTAAYLSLDGREQGHACDAVCPSPTVNASHATFDHVDVTNDHTAICFVLGSDRWGRADYTTIEHSRIHDCGVLPAENHDHGIYVAASTGSRIVDDWIYDNADKGILFFADGDGTLVRGNVIDGNGEGVSFGALGSETSSGNVVEDNVIADSNVLYNVQSYYGSGDTVGSGNVVRHNCIGGGARETDWSPAGISEPEGLRLEGNVHAVPWFVDRAGGDLRLAPGSPCQGVLPPDATASMPGPGGTIDPGAAPTGALAGIARAGARSVRLRARPRRVRPGRRVRFRGTVTTPPPVQGRELVLRVLEPGGRWTRLAHRTLRRHGRFSIRRRLRGARPRSTMVAQAVVPGVARSRPLLIHVRRRAR